MAGIRTGVDEKASVKEGLENALKEGGSSSLDNFDIDLSTIQKTAPETQQSSTIQKTAPETQQSSSPTSSLTSSSLFNEFQEDSSTIESSARQQANYSAQPAALGDFVTQEASTEGRVTDPFSSDPLGINATIFRVSSNPDSQSSGSAEYSHGGSSSDDQSANELQDSEYGSAINIPSPGREPNVLPENATGKLEDENYERIKRESPAPPTSGEINRANSSGVWQGYKILPSSLPGKKTPGGGLLRSAREAVASFRDHFGKQKVLGNTIRDYLHASPNVKFGWASIGMTDMVEAYTLGPDGVVRETVNSFYKEHVGEDPSVLLADESLLRRTIKDCYKDGYGHMMKTSIRETSSHVVMVTVHEGRGIRCHPLMAPGFNADHDGDMVTISFDPRDIYSSYGGTNDVVGKQSADFFFSEGSTHLPIEFWHPNPVGTLDEAEDRVRGIFKVYFRVEKPLHVRKLAQCLVDMAGSDEDVADKAYNDFFSYLNENAINMSRGNTKARVDIFNDLVTTFYDYNSANPDLMNAYLDIVVENWAEMSQGKDVMDALSKEDIGVIPLTVAEIPPNAYALFKAKNLFIGFYGGNPYFREFSNIYKEAKHSAEMDGVDPETKKAYTWIAENLRSATAEEKLSLVTKGENDTDTEYTKNMRLRTNVLRKVGPFNITIEERRDKKTYYTLFKTWLGKFIDAYELEYNSWRIDTAIKKVDGSVEYTIPAVNFRGKDGMKQVRAAIIRTYGQMSLRRFLGDIEFDLLVEDISKQNLPMPVGWQTMTLDEFVNSSWWMGTVGKVDENTFTTFHKFMFFLAEEHAADMKTFGRSFNLAASKAGEAIVTAINYEKENHEAGLGNEGAMTAVIKALSLLGRDVFSLFNITTLEPFENHPIGKAFLKVNADVKSVVYSAYTSAQVYWLEECYKYDDEESEKKALQWIDYLQSLSPVWNVLMKDFVREGELFHEVSGSTAPGYDNAIEMMKNPDLPANVKEDIVGRMIDRAGILPKRRLSEAEQKKQHKRYQSRWENDFFAYNLMVKPGRDSVYMSNTDYLKSDFKAATNAFKQFEKRGSRASRAEKIRSGEFDKKITQINKQLIGYVRDGKPSPFTRVSANNMADIIVLLATGQFSLGEKINQLAVANAAFNGLCQKLLGGTWSDFQAYLNTGTLSWQDINDSPELMAKLHFDPDFNPIIHRNGDFVTLDKQELVEGDIDGLREFFADNPELIDLFQVHEFIPETTDYGRDNEKVKRVRVTNGYSGNDAWTEFIDRPSFFALVTLFANTSSTSIEPTAASATQKALFEVADFVNAVKSGYISYSDAMDSIMNSFPEFFLNSEVDEYDGRMITGREALNLYLKDLLEPDGRVAPGKEIKFPQRTISEDNARAFFNVMQGFSSMMTATQVWVNGTETERNAMIAFIANYRDPSAISDEPVEIPVPVEWDSSCDVYEDLVEQSSGLPFRADTLVEIKKTIGTDGTCVFHLPINNTSPIGPSADNFVTDGSRGSNPLRMAPSIGDVESKSREDGTERGALKAKKRGYDGLDSIVKFAFDKLFGTSSEWDTLRSIIDGKVNSLQEARSMYAEFLWQHLSDEYRTFFSKNQITELASWCVYQDANGNVKFMSLRQLQERVDFLCAQYRIEADKVNHKDIQDYIISGLRAWADEPVLLSEIASDVRTTPISKTGYTRAVSIKSSSINRRAPITDAYIEENRAEDSLFNVRLIGPKIIATDIEVARKRGNRYVGPKAEAELGSYINSKGQWEVDFFENRMNEVLPETAIFAIGEGYYDPDDVWCIQTDTSGIERKGDADMWLFAAARGRAVVKPGKEDIPIRRLFPEAVLKAGRFGSLDVEILGLKECLLLREKGESIKWDKSATASQLKKEMIEDFWRKLPDVQDTGKDEAFIRDTHPGRVVAIAKCKVTQNGLTLGSDNQSETYYAPVFLYDVEQEHGSPYDVRVDSVTTDDLSISIEWTSTSYTGDESGKMLMDMAGSGKSQTSTEVDMVPERYDNAAGFPVHAMQAWESIRSRFTGELVNHLMTSCIWYTHLCGYNLADHEEAIPIENEFSATLKEKILAGTATIEDFKKAKSLGQTWWSDDKNVNDYIEYIVTKSINYKVNPLWMLAASVKTSDGSEKLLPLYTDWMIYTGDAPALIDGFFAFYHSMNENFCPYSSTDNDADDGHYYWDKDMLFLVSHPYVNPKTGEKHIYKKRERVFYGRHRFDDNFSGWYSPGRTHTSVRSMTSVVRKGLGGANLTSSEAEALLKSKFGGFNANHMLEIADLPAGFPVSNSDVSIPSVQNARDVFDMKVNHKRNTKASKKKNLSDAAKKRYGDKSTVIIPVFGNSPKNMLEELANDSKASSWMGMKENIKDSLKKIASQNADDLIVIRTDGGRGVGSLAINAVKELQKDPNYKGRFLIELCIDYRDLVKENAKSKFSKKIQQKRVKESKSNKGKKKRVYRSNYLVAADIKALVKSARKDGDLIITYTNKTENSPYNYRYEAQIEYMAKSADLILIGADSSGAEAFTNYSDVMHFKRLFADVYSIDNWHEGVDDFRGGEVAYGGLVDQVVRFVKNSFSENFDEQRYLKLEDRLKKDISDKSSDEAVPYIALLNILQYTNARRGVDLQTNPMYKNLIEKEISTVQSYIKSKLGDDGIYDISDEEARIYLAMGEFVYSDDANVYKDLANDCLPFAYKTHAPKLTDSTNELAHQVGKNLARKAKDIITAQVISELAFEEDTDIIDSNIDDIRKQLEVDRALSATVVSDSVDDGTVESNEISFDIDTSVYDRINELSKNLDDYDFVDDANAIVAHVEATLDDVLAFDGSPETVKKVVSNLKPVLDAVSEYDLADRTFVADVNIQIKAMEDAAEAGEYLTPETLAPKEVKEAVKKDATEFQKRIRREYEQQSFDSANSAFGFVEDDSTEDKSTGFSQYDFIEEEDLPSEEEVLKGLPEGQRSQRERTLSHIKRIKKMFFEFKCAFNYEGEYKADKNGKLTAVSKWWKRPRPSFSHAAGEEYDKAEAARDALWKKLSRGLVLPKNPNDAERMKIELTEQILMCAISYGPDNSRPSEANGWSGGMVRDKDGKPVTMPDKIHQGKITRADGSVIKAENIPVYDISDTDRTIIFNKILHNLDTYHVLFAPDMTTESHLKVWGDTRISIPVPKEVATVIFNDELRNHWGTIDAFMDEQNKYWKTEKAYMAENSDVWYGGQDNYGQGRGFAIEETYFAIHGTTKKDLDYLDAKRGLSVADRLADGLGLDAGAREAHRKVNAAFVEAARKRNGSKKVRVTDRGKVTYKDKESLAQEGVVTQILSLLRSLVQSIGVLEIIIPFFSIAEGGVNGTAAELSIKFMEKKQGIEHMNSDVKLLKKDKGFVAKCTQILDAMDLNDFDRIVVEADNGGVEGQSELSKKNFVEYAKNELGMSSLMARASYDTKKMSEFSHKLTSGSIINRPQAAMTMINFIYDELVLEYRANKKEFTADDFSALISADPEGFLDEMMKTDIGRRAALFAAQSTVGGANMLNAKMNRFFGEHPNVYTGTTLFFYKYANYGVALGQSWIPFSHVAQYLVINNKAKEGTSDVNYIWDSADFRKLLVMDLILFAGKGMFLILVTSIVSALNGVEPPDDPENLYVLGEWKIGGVAIKDNWMFRDLFGFWTPTVVAGFAAANSEDGFDPMKFWINGIAETAQGMPFDDMPNVIWSMLNWETLLATEEDDLDRKWNKSMNDTDYVWGVLSGALLSRLGTDFDLPFVSEWYRGTFGLADTEDQHSANQVYAYDKGGNKTTVRTDWYDAQIRKATRRSYTAAYIMNAINAIQGNTSGTIDRPYTGYARGEMPLISYLNTSHVAKSKDYTIDETMSDTEKNEVVATVLNDLRLFSSAEEAAENGMIIPYATRTACLDALYDLDNAVRNDFYRRKANGEFYGDPEGQQRAAEQMQKYRGIIYNIRSMVKSTEIPATPDKYNQYVTSYTTRYYWASDRKPATWLEYQMNRSNGSVIAEVYPVGDKKSSTNPFVIVDNSYGTYDFQTPVSWAGELTDPEKVKALYGDDVIPEGSLNAGENVYDVLTGYGKAADNMVEGARSYYSKNRNYADSDLIKGTNESNGGSSQGTTGSSSTQSSGGSSDNSVPVNGGSYTPTEDQLDKVLNGYYIDPVTGNIVFSGGAGYDPNAEYEPTDEGSDGSGSGNGYRRYYASGGGSRSGGNIYSRASSGGINAPRAATMYSKTPSYTRFASLLPKFETKGSREAYKRQDI